MAAAPLAVLGHLDPVGVVPTGLVRLIVAPLAILAGEGDGYPYFSGHGSV
jgi:hypothetical protein